MSQAIANGELNWGDEVNCTVAPDDLIEWGDPVTGYQPAVVNTPPVVGAFLDAPLPYEDAVCGDSTSDPDDFQFLSASYTWFDGEDTIIGTDSDTLSNTLFDAGDEIRCEIVVFDGYDYSETANSDLVTVQTPPV